MDKSAAMKVFHKKYGYGKVTKTTYEKIYVDFSGKKRIFDYPDAFDKGYILAVEVIESEKNYKEVKEPTQDNTSEPPENFAVALSKDDIKHHILAVNINQRYKKNMAPQELYDAVRGVWRASWKRVQEVEYVFGFYEGVIVAVYKPAKWFICKEAPEEFAKFREKLTPRVANRVFFVDMSFEQGLPHDENQKFYIGKSLHNLDINVNAQNPVAYLDPQEYAPIDLPVEKYREYVLDATSQFGYEKMFEAINAAVGTNYTGWMKACWPNPDPDIPFRLWFIKLAKTKNGVLIPAANNCLNTISDDWNEVIMIT